MTEETDRLKRQERTYYTRWGEHGVAHTFDSEQSRPFIDGGVAFRQDAHRHDDRTLEEMLQVWRSNRPSYVKRADERTVREARRQCRIDTRKSAAKTVMVLCGSSGFVIMLLVASGALGFNSFVLGYILMAVTTTAVLYIDELNSGGNGIAFPLVAGVIWPVALAATCVLGCVVGVHELCSWVSKLLKEVLYP